MGNIISELKGKSNIIIADYDYLPLLFKIKNKNPDIDIKIISKNDALSKLSFDTNERAMKILLHNQINYRNASQILSIFKTKNFEKDPYINSKFKLVSKILKNNFDYSKLLFFNKQIWIFELQRDKQIIGLLEKNNLSFKNIYFTDLLDKPITDISKQDVLCFDDKFSQYMYIFAEIRKNILSDKHDLQKMQILVKDEYDVFYAKLIGSLFGIDVYSELGTKLYDNIKVKEKIRSFRKNQKISFSKDELQDEYCAQLNEIIKTFELDKLTIEEACNNLIEITSSIHYDDKNFVKKGIKITNKFTFVPDGQIYITNFVYDEFYQVFKDTGVLSDKQRELIGDNSSYDKTLLDKQKKLNYLKYNNIALISRVKRHIDEHIYDSQFVKELGLTNKSVSSLNSGIYTDLAKKINLMNQLDKTGWLKPIGELNSYENQIGTVKTSDIESFSPSMFKEYFSCPFKFYLNRKLKLQTDDEKYNMWLGDLAHEVVRSVYSDNFDFPKAFANGCRVFEKEAKIKLKDNPKYQVFLQIAKRWLEIFTKHYSNQIKELKARGQYFNHIVESGKNDDLINKLLEDKELNKKYNVRGRPDCILFTRSPNKKYYSIIDYKIGSERFEPRTVFLGNSLQLPIYWWLIKDDKLVANATLGGLFIKPLLASSLGKAVVGDKKKDNVNYKLANVGNLDKYAKLQGITTKDETYKLISEISNFVDAKPIRGIPKYTLDDVANEAKEQIIRLIRLINDNNFQIDPKPKELASKLSEDTKLSCEYCDYRNVCYLNKIKQPAKDYSKLVKEHDAKYKEVK